MKRKGQAAMEYITTYGWAILIVIIIGVVVWQLGLFDFESRVAPGYTGFSVLVPKDWAMLKSGTTCALSVQLLNSAGEQLDSPVVVGGVACAPDTIEAGSYTICGKSFDGCGDAGSHFNELFAVEYHRSSDNQSFQTAGELWGNIEES